VYTIQELVQRGQRRRRELSTKGGHWGPWKYDPTDHTLEHADGYWVSLVGPDAFGPINDSATALDVIAQVAGKTGRFSASDVGHLVRALDELLDLQASFCGMGRDKRRDPLDVLPPKDVL
jgi:hypothetical protein